jgi:2-oxoisovalerate dehydrogenase E1 component alpha subunit
VPEPASRPKEKPDFSNLSLDEAGAVSRPDTQVAAAEMRDLAYSLVRVLAPNGEALGDWNPQLHSNDLKRGLRNMLLTRLFDERMFRAQRQGKASFYMKCTGEEAIACAQSMALSKHDMFFPTYRVQGLLISRGYPLVDMMNQIFSNEGGRWRMPTRVIATSHPLLLARDRPQPTTSIMR